MLKLRNSLLSMGWAQKSVSVDGNQASWKSPLETLLRSPWWLSVRLSSVSPPTLVKTLTLQGTMEAAVGQAATAMNAERPFWSDTRLAGGGVGLTMWAKREAASDAPLALSYGDMLSHGTSMWTWLRWFLRLYFSLYNSLQWDGSLKLSVSLWVLMELLYHKSSKD